MSDTDAMVRLMDNAAHHLQLRLNEMTGKMGDAQDTRTIAAMAYARGVLQMVSASVAPESASVVSDLISNLTEDIYDVWAEESSGVRMSPAELQSIERFLRHVYRGAS